MSKNIARMGRRHMWVPDTQIKPGVNTDHLAAAGNYAVAKKPDVIVVAGDWWEMASLSTYEEKSSKYWHHEDMTYRADVDAGNAGMSRFMTPIAEERARLIRNKDKQWNPELHFLGGNHEERILRAVYANKVLEGTFGLHNLDIERWGFSFHPYMEIVEIDGVLYAHHFQGTTASAMIETRIKAVGNSFTQGHLTSLRHGIHYNAKGQRRHGLVAGAFYPHEDAWRNPQEKNYWRGIVIKNEVCDGEYDPMFVSLDWLVRNYL